VFIRLDLIIPQIQFKRQKGIKYTRDIDIAEQKMGCGQIRLLEIDIRIIDHDPPALENKITLSVGIPQVIGEESLFPAGICDILMIPITTVYPRYLHIPFSVR